MYIGKVFCVPWRVVIGFWCRLGGVELKESGDTSLGFGSDVVLTFLSFFYYLSECGADLASYSRPLDTREP
jgi:hypothetical protein